MHTLERHDNARSPCWPPTQHCDNCNKGFASYQSLWKHKQKCQGPYPVGQKRHADISTVSLEIPPTFVAAAAAKESSLEPRTTNPKIQALLMKSLMMIQRDRYHHKQFIRVFVSYHQPQHYLRQRKYRRHLLHHHHHIHLRKCCYRHRNRCYRSHPQKL